MAAGKPAREGREDRRTRQRNAFFKILGLCLVLALALQYAGFCWHRMRILSAEEQIGAALAYLVREARLEPYRSVAAFKREHPHCCSISRDPPDVEFPPASLPDRLLGAAAGYVRISYTIGIPRSTGPVRARRTRIVAITNCGDARDRY